MPPGDRPGDGVGPGSSAAALSEIIPEDEPMDTSAPIDMESSPRCWSTSVRDDEGRLPAPDVFTARDLISNQEREATAKKFARRWKGLADEVKAAGYSPLLWMSNEQNVPQRIRDYARYLDELTDSICCTEYMEWAPAIVDYASPDAQRRRRTVDYERRQEEEAVRMREGGEVGTSALVEDMKKEENKEEEEPKRSDEDYVTLRIVQQIVLCQGESLAEFKKHMASLDFSEQCNCIWESDAIAYRCNTCALTPCMSLCAECFRNGDHEGHDVTRFFSREGGACDCGNKDVLKESGFCARHGEKGERPPPPPQDAVSLAEIIAMKRILVLMRMVRGFATANEKSKAEYVELEENGAVLRALDGEYKPPPAKSDVEKMGDEMIRYINLSEWREKELINKLVAPVTEVISMGGPLREFIGRVLIDQNLYAALTADSTAESFKSILHDWWLGSQPDFERDQQSGDLILPPEELRLTKFSCLLDEYLYFMWRGMFPQSMINLALSLLGDQDYRMSFAARFFSQYAYTTHLVIAICESKVERRRPNNQASNDVTTIASKVIHISVQILSSKIMCVLLDEHIGLMEILLKNTLIMIERRTININIAALASREMGQQAEAEPNNRNWTVIDASNNDMVYFHGYWFVMGDLQNMLSHADCVVRMCRNTNCLTIYTKILARMQSMQPITRIVVGEHVRNDSQDEFQRNFTVEMEIATASMFNIMGALKAQPDPEALVKLWTAMELSIEEWIKAMMLERAGDSYQLTKYSISFHLPLSRHLSSIISWLGAEPVLDTRIKDSFLKKKSLLQVLMLHPLRIMACRAESMALMWVRNGYQMRIPSILYGQQSLAASFSIPDLELIRFCAANLGCEEVLHSMLDSFSLADVFIYKQTGSPIPFSGVARVTKRFERNLDTNTKIDALTGAFLKLISELVVLRSVADQGVRDGIMKETICSLAVGDSPYSRIRMLLTEKGNRSQEIIDRHFDDVLKEVATFVEADRDDHLEQGIYRIKKEAIRDHFCPIAANARLGMPKNAAAAVMAAINLERDIVGRPEFRVKDVWPGYRICPWNNEYRGKYIRSIPKLIVNKRFLETMTYILEQAAFDFRRESVDVMFRESTLQLAIYLLTLGASYARTLSTEERDDFSACLHDEFEAPKQWTDDQFEALGGAAVSDVYPGRRSLARAILALCPWIMTSIPEDSEAPDKGREGSPPSAAPDAPAETVRRAVRAAVKLPVKDRILAGTPAEYYGRLLAQLYGMDSKFRSLLDEAYAEMEENADEPMDTTKNGDASNSPTSTVAAKKRNAAALRQRIMDQKRARDAERMAQLMDSEHMTQEDFDRLNVKDTSAVQQFECPICGDETPNTFDNPMGLMVLVQPNMAHRLAVPMTSKDRGLLETDTDTWVMPRKEKELSDEVHKQNMQLVVDNVLDDIFGRPDGSVPGPSTAPPDLPTMHYSSMHWLKERAGIAHDCAGEDHSDFLHARSPLEMRTCGHHMHFTCFHQWKDAIGATHVLRCPKCRFTGNKLCPIALPSGMENCSGISSCQYTAMNNSLRRVVSIITNGGETNPDPAQPTLTEMIKKMTRKLLSLPTNNVPEFAMFPHSHMLAILQTLIDRNLLHDRLNIMEKRPKCTTLLSEHLAFYAPYLIRDQEECTYIRLMLAETMMVDPIEIIETDAEGGTKTTLRLDISPDDRPRRCVPYDDQPRPSHIMDDSDTIVKYEASFRSKKLHQTLRKEGGEEKEMPMDELNILLSTKDIEARRPKTCPLTEDIAFILSGPRELNKKEARGFRGKRQGNRFFIRFPDDVSKDVGWNFKDKYLWHLPSLFLDSRAHLLRMSSIIIASNYGKEEKMSLLSSVALRILGHAVLRSHMILCTRCPVNLIEEWSREGPHVDDITRKPESFMSIRRLVARSFLVSPQSIAKLMATWIVNAHVIDGDVYTEQGDLNMSAYTTDIASVITDYLRFTAQFWHESNMKPLPEGWRTAATPADLSEVSRHLFGVTCVDELAPMLPSEFVLARWMVAAREILTFTMKSKRKFITEPLRWRPFTMLRLPEQYDDLFQRFFGRSCDTCNKVPTHPLVCLICAKMVCLDPCCLLRLPVMGRPEMDPVSVYEPSKHVAECAHLACPFMAINASVVVFIYKNMGCAWGSVYLDAHGEEDRNLKRGKPLMLSQKRMDALQRDWLSMDLQRIMMYRSLNELSVFLDASHYRM